MPPRRCDSARRQRVAESEPIQTVEQPSILVLHLDHPGTDACVGVTPGGLTRAHYQAIRAHDLRWTNFWPRNTRRTAAFQPRCTG
jgi:hypothetical protein